MLPIAGRPLLARTLDWLQTYGVAEVALNLHHLPEVVRDGLGDGSAWGMRLHYSYEPTLLGTAGAVRRIAELLPGWFDQTFLLIYGDMLLDIALADLLALHQQRGAILTMALKRTTTPQSQGMIEVDVADRVRRFVEKPRDWDGGDLANMRRLSMRACDRIGDPAGHKRLRLRYHPCADRGRRASLWPLGAGAHARHRHARGLCTGTTRSWAKIERSCMS